MTNPVSRPSPLGQVRVRNHGRDSTGFAWTLVAIGGVSLGLGLSGLWLGCATSKWPRVEAEIVDSRTIARVDTPVRDHAGITPVAAHDRDAFAADAIAFRYEVNGVVHIGADVERGDLGLRTSAKSHALEHDHPIGSHTTVVVDPTDPENAYLLAGPSATAKTVTGVGAAFVLIGFWMRGLILRRLGRSRRMIRSRADRIA